MIEGYFKEKLGPILHYYLQKLDEYTRYLDDGNTTFLYCTRAGYSIHALYKNYLHLIGREIESKHKLFNVSRMLACKAAFNKNFDYVENVFINEFKFKSAWRLVNAIFASEKSIPLSEAELEALNDIEADTYFDSILNNDASCQYIRDYFSVQQESFSSYLSSLLTEKQTDKKQRVVLVDSGWQGTIHNILQMSYPQYEFHSLLFGRITNENSFQAYLPRMYGLVFEQKIQSRFAAYSPEKPQSCFTLHRHLIENMLEPHFASVESVNKVNDRWCANNQEDIDKADPFSKEEMKGVLQYLEENAFGLRRGQIQQRYYDALLDIKNRIIHPGEDDIRCMGYFSRSVDFGKPGGVRVLRPPVDRYENDSIDLRIEHSLWSMAQIAIEYDEKTARELQLQRLQEAG